MPLKPSATDIISDLTARLFLFLTVVTLLAVLHGCSGSRDFNVDVATDDNGTQNVTLVYFADGVWHRESLPAVDGRFSFRGRLAAPTFVEVFTADGARLGEFIVEGGDDIKIRLSAINPENVKVEGNKDSEHLIEFLRDNRKVIESHDQNGLNAAIEAYVRENPKEFLSTVLLTCYYSVPGNEKRVLELYELIPEKYRPSDFTLGFEQLLSASLATDTVSVTSVRGFSTGDTARVYSPRGSRLNLMMLTDETSRSADSIRSLAAALRAGAPKSEMLRITDFGCDRDTLYWHSSLRGLPEDYPSGVERLWLNEGPANEGIAPAAPSAIPYFMLTDSTGRLLYRSPSVAATKAAFGRLLRDARK